MEKILTTQPPLSVGSMQLSATLITILIGITAAAAANSGPAAGAGVASGAALRRDTSNQPSQITCKDPESLPSDCACNKIEGVFCGNEAINPACSNKKQFECHADGTTCWLGLSSLCKDYPMPCKAQGSAPSGCLCNKIEGTFCGNETVNAACTNLKQFECHTDGSTCLLADAGSCGGSTCDSH
ncbi:hypothetical protein Moror_14122 [Moniliophthora roreri MCA 2997]|uniref:Uncharacterized protein n=2 Tax=Moniliophthora roreri TaxID=221103 RepID=V2YT60_MONRO|nr:hypothetical protein Moror_14122 [Moniliophthora roreri MCA 2997]KAI3619855.1 hypothetical protein WG66_002776 [Moniliophthora roreri]